MSPKSPFLERTVRNFGALLLVFALLTTTVFATIPPNWAPGGAPQKAPGDGNVELSTGSSPSSGVDETKSCSAGKAISAFDLSNTSAPTCVSVGGSSSGGEGGILDVQVDSCDPGYSIREISFDIDDDVATGSVVCEEDTVGTGGGGDGDDFDATKSCGDGYAIKGFDLADESDPTCVEVGGDSIWTDHGNYISYTHNALTAKIGKRLTKIDGYQMHGHRTEYGSGTTMIGVTENGIAGASFKTGNNAFNVFTEGNRAHFRVYKNESFIFDNLGSNLQGGKVGIGTANPTYRLDVVGSIRSSDNVGGQAFYDINNLQYKVDPTGSSKLNEATFSAITLGGVRRTTWPEGGGTSLWTKSGSNIYYNSGKVGIKTASPKYELDIVGSARASGFMGGQAFYDTNDLQYKVDPNGMSKVNSIAATGTICDRNGCIGGGGGGGGGTPCDWNGWAIRQTLSRSAEFYGKVVAVGELCGGGNTCDAGTKVNFYCQGGVITGSGIVNYCRSCGGVGV